MAFPAQAVERLAQEPLRTPGWSGRLLMFAATLFLISVFAYFGLLYGAEPYLQGQANTLNGQAKSLTQQVEGDNQTKLISFYSQLANLSSLLDQHVYSSAIFSLLEKNVYPNVFFTKFSWSGTNNQLSLSGVAKSAQDVPAQIQIFQNAPGVDKVTFNNLVALPGGQWQFDAVLTVDPSMFVSGRMQNAAPTTLPAVPTMPTTATTTAATTSTATTTPR